MSKLLKADCRNETRPIVVSSRSRWALSGRIAFLLVIMIIALGNDSCPPKGAPTISCSNPHLRLDPGTCVTFPNPCSADGQWARRPDLDALEFQPRSDQPFFSDAGLQLVTTRMGDEVTRSICVAATAPLFPSEAIAFRYAKGTQYGTNDLSLTVGPQLNVTVTALPSTITAGESSQLVASVTGGFPPYFFSWVPASDLNDSDIAAPTARPLTTTEYRVRVQDSGGQETIGSVTVAVGFEVAATATPAEVVAGEPTALLALTRGGTPPFRFSWTPTQTLDDSLRQDPTARPTTTTVYTVTATDGTGAQRTASVQVIVPVINPPPLNASFDFTIVCCPTIEADASASTGDISTYTWDLSWTALSPDFTSTQPFASFVIQEFDRGTITLTVTDRNGNTASTIRNFPAP